jgi:hypothetical protein
LNHGKNKTIRLACDSSSYGVGAVFSHVIEDGKERPIAFASRTLNDGERNYPHVEKEALSLIFGEKKFHKYFYGRRFLLVYGLTGDLSRNTQEVICSYQRSFMTSLLYDAV